MFTYSYHGKNKQTGNFVQISSTRAHYCTTCFCQPFTSPSPKRAAKQSDPVDGPLFVPQLGHFSAAADGSARSQ